MKSAEEGSAFDQNTIDIPRFPKNEKIRTMEISENLMILITESNKILRWKMRDPQSQCVEYDLPETKDENTTFFQQINPGNMIMNAIKKLPFGDDKKEVVNIDRVFIDSRGAHTILASDKGENFYFHYSSEKIRYLGKLKGVIITSISWNEDSTDDSTKVWLLKIKHQILNIFPF